MITVDTKEDGIIINYNTGYDCTEALDFVNKIFMSHLFVPPQWLKDVADYYAVPVKSKAIVNIILQSIIDKKWSSL
jgi:hypothetical protein